MTGQREVEAEREAWRNLPATPEQLQALRIIATATGHTFDAHINRADAWKRIRSAARHVPRAWLQACAPPWATLD